jgi:hypothetical protein
MAVPKLTGPIQQAETIAEGSSIRELANLRERYGNGHWKKKKGVAWVDRGDGVSFLAEVHWYEAHGIGKVKIKVKRWL